MPRSYSINICGIKYIPILQEKKLSLGEIAKCGETKWFESVGRESKEKAEYQFYYKNVSETHTNQHVRYSLDKKINLEML